MARSAEVYSGQRTVTGSQVDDLHGVAVAVAGERK